MIGLILFGIGVFINWQSDHILRNLRKNNNNKKSDDASSSSGKGSYVIPYGGFFRYVSAPHYFGEIIEWTGFALIAMNLGALSFVIWTAANLIPRALAHDKWYRMHFSNYPVNRKAIFPGLL